MAPNKTSGKRDKGKIDQFFPKLVRENKDDDGGERDDNNAENDNDNSDNDDDDDDDQWNISLSELVDRKRPRLCTKPGQATTSPKTGGTVTGLVPVSSKLGAKHIHGKTKENNSKNSTATSGMIDTSTFTANTITNNNNNGNSIDLDNKVSNTNSTIDNLPPTLNKAEKESSNNQIPDDTSNGNSTSQAVPPTSNLIRPANVPSLRRSLGHAVADFVPPDDTNHNKPNWLDRLFQRSLQGHRLNANSIPKSCHNWIKSPPSRVALTSPCTKIECLAWDSLGALLCVAGPRTIFIYDWDMVRAADMASKADRQRQTKACCYQIPPLLQFSVPHVISIVQWNPYHPDQLAVGFKLQGTLHLYQLDSVLEWREKHPSAQYPPRSCYQPLQATTTESQKRTVNSILFLPNSIVVSMGSIIDCWNLQYKLQWRYQPPSNGTCLAKMTDTWILVATVRGQFLLVDTSNKERAALSLQFRPIVIHEWDTLTVQPVVDCQIIPLLDKNYFQLMWITQEGFVYQTTIIIHHHATASQLSQTHPSGTFTSTSTTPKTRTTTTMSLAPRGPSTVVGKELATKKMSSSSLTTPTAPTKTKLPTATYAPKFTIYCPPKASIYNANKEYITDGHYSIPPEPIISHHTNSAWIWPQVPKMSRYLSHHDKFVVDRMTIVRDPDRALIWYSQRKSVSIPASQPPQVMALHPDSEWIVMGVGTELVLLANRCSTRKSSIPFPVEQQPRDDVLMDSGERPLVT